MDKFYDAYLSVLHVSNPATKVYTKVMLAEDYAIGLTLWYYGLAPILVPILADPNNQLWTIMKPACERFAKAMYELNCN